MGAGWKRRVLGWGWSPAASLADVDQAEGDEPLPCPGTTRLAIRGIRRQIGLEHPASVDIHLKLAPQELGCPPGQQHPGQEDLEVIEGAAR